MVATNARKIPHIRNMARFNQRVDFGELNQGENRRPTDIDGYIEWKNKAHIFIEVKLLNTELPHGQRLALERLATDCSHSGKYAIVIVAEHTILTPDITIMSEHCVVRKVYQAKSGIGSWVQIEPVTLKQAVDKTIKYCDA